MAVYSVIGRMRTYAITGRAFGNDIVPPHREGFGAIQGAGVVSIEPLLSGAAEAEGSGHLEASVSPNFKQAGNSVSVGDTASEGTGAHTGQPQATGAGSIVLDTFAIQGKGVTVIGVGDPQLDQTGAHNADGSTLTGAGAPTASGRTTLSLLEALTNAGLTSGLKMCLDAGDINSYSGSGQTWTDVSGNASNVTRGANSSAAADDPTYNGTAGNVSENEFWSTDGGDHFQLASANPDWVNNLHKDNATGTVLLYVYFGATGVASGVIGTAGSSGVGFRIGPSGADNIALAVRNDTTTTFYGQQVITANTWYFVAVSWDESVGSDGGFTFANGTTVLFDSTVPSPSTAAAANPLSLMSRGGADTKMPSGSRLAAVAVFEGVAFTEEQVETVFALTRGRFGI